ncbi:hypothetical protein AVT69_gp261 [Pseudomonas phage PhiPA3]|uniref:Uncharacterized protein 263 n=1 Tax=Pseudomonas phage PhiPA3 TaxID=998086 RepID=F8SJA2_BPPA3|nr:hypothetical protein AVT69_gp261 [Pseudomonas phage PhiPA3]AEH03686.1 hypothetical protein [Pseudomonas phage PhiPA3]
MELLIPLKEDNDFQDDIFKYGDLSGCISVVDKNGNSDYDYQVSVEEDRDFPNEWTVVIQQAVPDTAKLNLKFKRYWFKYNSVSGHFAGEPFFYSGLSKRLIRVEVP